MRFVHKAKAMLIRILGLVCIISSLSLFAPSAYAVWNKAPVAQKQTGYARMIFDWIDPTAYQYDIRGNVLEITFNQTFSGDLKNILDKIPDYIERAYVYPDRKKIRFDLRRPFVVRSYLDGNAMVFDLLGKPAPYVDPPEYIDGSENPDRKITPPVKYSQESNADKDVSDSKYLNVRTGDHKSEGYYRFVFEWPNKVSFEISDKNTVNFSSFKDINLKILSKSLPAELKKIRYRKSAKGMDVQFTDDIVKVFNIDTKVVVDVNYGMTSKPQEPRKNEEINITTAKGVAEPPVPNPAPAVDVEKAPLVADAPKVEGVTNVAINNVATTPEPVPAENATDKKQNDSSYKYSRVVSLSFPWSKETGAAVFKRYGYIWIVFDRLKDIDFEELKRMGGDVVEDIVQLPHSKATVIRILTLPQYNPTIRREGLLWIVDLMQQPIRALNKIDIIPRFSIPDSPSLFLAVPETGRLVSMVDPESGEMLNIIPVSQLGWGVSPERDYPEAVFLPTAQGIVIKPRIDALAIKLSNSGVSVVNPNGGFSVSRDIDHLNDLMRLKKANDIARPFDVKTWARGGEKFIHADTIDMMDLVAGLPKKDRGWARLELARYKVANSLGADALGVLKIIEADNQDIAQIPAFYAVRGMANFLMHRYNDAANDFANQGLANEDEAAFWRAATEALIAEPEKQSQTLSNLSSYIRNYPRDLKTKLALVGLKSTLMAEDDLNSQNFIEMATNKENTKSQQAELDYYSAKWNEFTGNFNTAINLYQYLENYADDRKYAALAKRECVKLELEVKRISKKDAEAKLETMRFAWRDGNFEFDTMKLLADLYTSDAKYGDALRLLREVEDTLPKNDARRKETREKMEQVFETLYIEDKADDLSPVTALGLYDEFSELTPEGKKGDEIIRKLADRLVSVDLLDKASDLLQYMLKTRQLTPEEKATIGIKQALINLINRNPAKALNSLDVTYYPEMSEPMQAATRRLRARAMADMGKVDDGIALIADDDTKEAKLLRSEIYWKASRWDDASDAIKALIEKPVPGQVLKDEQAQLIMDWVTALRLAGRENVILRIRHNFMPYIKDTKFSNAFNLLTATMENTGYNYNSVLNDVKEAEGYKSFMDSYNDRMKQEATSGTASNNATPAVADNTVANTTTPATTASPTATPATPAQ